jgi:hypothetical protein
MIAILRCYRVVLLPAMALQDTLCSSEIPDRRVLQPHPVDGPFDVHSSCRLLPVSPYAHGLPFALPKPKDGKAPYMCLAGVMIPS